MNFLEDESITIGPPNVERYSYAMSKLFDEQLILNNINEGKLHSSIARIFGCFSNRCKRDWSGAHLALFIHQALTGEDIIIHGDGSQTRSLTNVSDIVEGLYRMLMKIDDLNGEIINLGSNKEMSVRESADIIVNYSEINNNGIMLPSYPELKEEQQEYIINCLIEYIKKTEVICYL